MWKQIPMFQWPEDIYSRSARTDELNSAEKNQGAC